MHRTRRHPAAALLEITPPRRGWLGSPAGPFGLLGALILALGVFGAVPVLAEQEAGPDPGVAWQDLVDLNPGVDVGGVATKADGALVVLDRAAPALLVYAPDGTPLSSVPLPPGSQPVALTTTADGSALVATRSPGSLLRVDDHGPAASLSLGPGQPLAVVATPSGPVALMLVEHLGAKTSGSAVVERIGPQQPTALASFGSQSDLPSSLALLPDGDLLVVGAWNSYGDRLSLHRLAPDGRLRGTLLGPTLPEPSDPSGTQLAVAHLAAAAPDGAIFVVAEQYEVQREQGFLTTLNPTGWALLRLDAASGAIADRWPLAADVDPRALVIDANGRPVVADAAQQRLLVLDTSNDASTPDPSASE